MSVDTGHLRQLAVRLFHAQEEDLPQAVLNVAVRLAKILLLGMEAREMAEGRWPSKRGRASQVRQAQMTGKKDYDSVFTELYESYYTRVFAFVYSRVNNVELTKDLTAEIFERAYAKGHSLREAGAYGAWLFAIARNVVVGSFRRRKRELNTMDRAKESVWLADRPPDPAEQAVQDEEIAELMRHFRTLINRDQEILSLKFEAGLTHGEIAQVMGMTASHVRVAVFRALKRLRDRVQAEKQKR